METRKEPRVDEQGFRAFFTAHYAALSNLGLLLTGNRGEAEELAQDALVRTLGAWSRIRDPALALAYARRTLVNHHRSLLRRTMTRIRLAHSLKHDRVESRIGEPDDERLVLWAALRRLPPRQRAVVVLRYFEDLPEAEVARTLGLPLGTVKSLNRRGLAKLRQAPEVAALQLTDPLG